MKPTMKALAGDLVAAFREHVAERLVPVCSKQEALTTVVNDLRAEVAELRERLSEIESKSLRRVA